MQCQRRLPLLQREPLVFCLVLLLLEARADVCAESLLFVVAESRSPCGPRWHSIQLKLGVGG